MKYPSRQRGFALLGLVMVVATITLVGFVAFRFLDAQDNTEVADKTQQTTQIASVQSTADVEKVTQQLDDAELESLDADLNREFDF